MISTNAFTALSQVKQTTYLTNGISCDLEQGMLKVEFVTPDIVRVQYTKENTWMGNGTDVCVPRISDKPVRLTYTKETDCCWLKSDSLMVRVGLNTASITYLDKEGRLLLRENQKIPRVGEKKVTEQAIYDEHSKQIKKTADGDKEIKSILRRDTIGHTWKYRINFEWQPLEALYGWGAHMEDYMNLRGKELYLCQHNLKAMVPVVNSTAGYGLLFDAGCAMMFKDNSEGSFVELEAAKQIDYYFMKGRTMDAVVANYRLLTGNSPMMPLYLFGYIQSKERYVSSDDLIHTLKEYRQRQIPIDMIVQDWNYWPQGQWGSMSMNPEFYPDKRKLADEIHSLHAKLMISIWPNAMNCPQQEDFKRKGLLLNGTSVYDAFNPSARELYWSYANKEFFSNGFDAWWCDASEPLDADWTFMKDGYGIDNHRQRWELNTNLLSSVLGAERSQLYSLYHAMGIYENQRLVNENKRVVNLTRSSYAGQQRYSTITWNGDTRATWQSFAQMIPAGLNFMATGCPYWTVDIGAFFTKNGAQWFWKGDYDKGVADMAYRELYTRMFQYGAFLPVFRSHGSDTPREVWRFGKPGEPFYESLIKMIHLRYRLLPYIYSLAGKVHRDNYTMTRALAFDFSADTRVADLKDEFMLGPALLVAPVTTPMYYSVDSRPLENIEKIRRVYLPAGAGWTDFWTGEKYKGGQWIVSEAAIDKIPLLVRQGSIIPMGPVMQYTSEKVDAEWEIRIYPGADSSFTVYEDEGDNYNYEKGKSSSFEMKWDDKNHTLTLSDRKGEYAGMPVCRRLKLVRVDKNSGIGVEENVDGKTIEYRGKHLKIKI
ncbi:MULTISPECIES: TIM-barrel domain-containing protein [Bacteroides]|uniref:glycoside hydrolase family 31 protein n=1 Tax=Bacteroides TaxID=816 RepID=UPI003518BDF0